MQQLIKTTVTIPEDLLQAARLKAVQERMTLSRLVRESLTDRISEKRTRKTLKKEPMHRLGVFKIGINKIYNKRSDLYEDHLRRKMGF